MVMHAIMEMQAKSIDKKKEEELYRNKKISKLPGNQTATSDGLLKETTKS